MPMGEYKKKGILSQYFPSTLPQPLVSYDFRTFPSQTWHHCILQCFSFKNSPKLYLNPQKRWHPRHPITMSSPAEWRAAWKTLSADLINVMKPCVSLSPWVSFYSSSEFVFQYQPTPVGLGSPWRLSLIAPAALFRRSSSHGHFTASSRLQAPSGWAISSAGYRASVTRQKRCWVTVTRAAH